MSLDIDSNSGIVTVDIVFFRKMVNALIEYGGTKLAGKPASDPASEPSQAQDSARRTEQFPDGARLTGGTVARLPRKVLTRRSAADQADFEKRFPDADRLN